VCVCVCVCVRVCVCVCARARMHVCRVYDAPASSQRCKGAGQEGSKGSGPRGAVQGEEGAKLPLKPREPWLIRIISGCLHPV
jgi:hypothetical protein